jgi:adenylate cyclase
MAAPDRALRGNLIRLLGIVPLAAAVSAFSFQPWARAHFQLFAAFFVLVASAVLFVALSILEFDEWQGLSSWVGLLNFAFLEIFIFVIIGLRLKYALLPGAVVLGAYLVLLRVVSDLPSARVFYYSYHLLTFVLLATFIAYFRERYIRRDFQRSAEVQEERKRFEDLLYNVIPQRIVTRIQGGEYPIADAHAEATVLFADLVGSTTLARRLAPHHLVEVLNDLYDQFDALAERHGVERIKTIGDSYMAVAGLDSRGIGDGAATTSALAMAMDMIVVAKETSKRLGQSLSIRIGIHTGSVIAGVLGVRKYQYDLWGDAVNIASRLESNGQPGRVQVSAATYWRSRHEYVFESRGEIEAKGIGKLEAYYLVGKKEENGEGGEP